MAGQPFYALITPLDPPSSGGGNPPGIWGGSGTPMPTPPIANAPGVPPMGPPGGSPPGTWGGSGEPFPGYGLPGLRPPGVPAHPIYYPPGIWGPNDPRPGWGLPGGGGGGGGSPPGFWGGSSEPFPGYGLPGNPPGFWGPNDPRPGWGLPGSPPGTWGGSGEPFPGWGLPPPGFELPDPPEGVVPDGKALVILYVPGEGFKAALIPKPGAPGNFPPDVQPVK